MVSVSTDGGAIAKKEPVRLETTADVKDAVVKNNGCQNSVLLQSMYDYTIVPSDKVKQRMDYFYTPYNQ